MGHNLKKIKYIMFIAAAAALLLSAGCKKQEYLHRDGPRLYDPDSVLLQSEQDRIREKISDIEAISPYDVLIKFTKHPEEDRDFLPGEALCATYWVKYCGVDKCQPVLFLYVDLNDGNFYCNEISKVFFLTDQDLDAMEDAARPYLETGKWTDGAMKFLEQSEKIIRKTKFTITDELYYYDDDDLYGTQANTPDM